ncbi:NTP transferase domain-containing protein [Candidatus Daviesbacteria bacterium]|nr:NTP transferase domain-containing protein [Candidatus Daviesbacteria bacterium]
MKIAGIILAAGKGTRFNKGAPSRLPKVLYKIGGRPMLGYTLDILKHLGVEPLNTVIVIGHQGHLVRQFAGSQYKYAIQNPPLGTGDALKCGLGQVPADFNTVLCLNGDDSAFYKPQTINKIIKIHFQEKSTITFVTLQKENPVGLGRIIRDQADHLQGIIEEKDATDRERQIKEVNDGLYIFEKNWLTDNIVDLPRGPQGEYYLVDLVKMALGQNKKVIAYKLTDASQWWGVNTPEELIQANQLMSKE